MLRISCTVELFPSSRHFCSKLAAEEIRIERTLDRYKLFRDEGPSSSGKFGPYLQSQRKPFYEEAAEQLIESGHAYRCFCTKTDENYGEITQRADEGDFILLKADSFPTYHLANVVDDHWMRISHVIRGSEWLTSVSKHVQLYRSVWFFFFPYPEASTTRKNKNRIFFLSSNIFFLPSQEKYVCARSTFLHLRRDSLVF
ncbi:unnamed protein product [Gongylonema pulchrum]|uniref:tRNA-synt_1c domain-containing protein n=1 Tax=Gongylonema pulchrum TaxID=637853 RepID=A0A183EGQ1_9BILA|nr:unnamed protein product [Gongylonema pulchrum]